MEYGQYPHQIPVLSRSKHHVLQVSVQWALTKKSCTSILSVYRVSIPTPQVRTKTYTFHISVPTGMGSDSRRLQGPGHGITQLSLGECETPTHLRFDWRKRPGNTPRILRRLSKMTWYFCHFWGFLLLLVQVCTSTIC